MTNKRLKMRNIDKVLEMSQAAKQKIETKYKVMMKKRDWLRDRKSS
jgi:hypothetical protein